MKKIFLLLLIFAVSVAGADITVKTQKKLSKNLLVNPGFEKLGRNGKPVNWWFDNCSNSPYVLGHIENENGNKFVSVELRRINSGYWTQKVAVEEGKRYCAAADLRAIGSTAMMWLRTDDWHDGKSPQHEPLSSTEVYIISSPRHGEEMISELSLFIDPSMLNSIEAKQWKRRIHEIVIPSGHNIHHYFFKPGAFFGAEGKVMIDNCYFGLAEHSVMIEVSGSKNFSRFEVMDNAGKIVASGVLDDSGCAEFKLPSLATNYKLEIFDNQGKKIYGGKL